MKTGLPANPGNYPLIILGLLGGVASGKSLVADHLKSLGAGILDGDRAGHEVLLTAEVKQEIFNRWGESVFTGEATRDSAAIIPKNENSLQNHQVNRAALAQIVFRPTAEGRADLTQLEQITHPRIKILLEQQLASFRSQGKLLAVLDAPVMIKAGWHKICDTIMFVDAPYAARLERARRRGWSERDFDEREAAQEPLEFKRSLADVTIDNSGTPAATKAQLDTWWQTVILPRSNES